jgi:hypothetical protein
MMIGWSIAAGIQQRSMLARVVDSGHVRATINHMISLPHIRSRSIDEFASRVSVD